MIRANFVVGIIESRMFARLGRKLTETRCRPRAAQRGRVGDCRPTNSESEVEGKRERERGRKGEKKKVVSRVDGIDEIEKKGIEKNGGGGRRTQSARNIAPSRAAPRGASRLSWDVGGK